MGTHSQLAWQFFDVPVVVVPGIHGRWSTATSDCLQIVLQQICLRTDTQNPCRHRTLFTVQQS